MKGARELTEITTSAALEAMSKPDANPRSSWTASPAAPGRRVGLVNEEAS